MKTRRQFPDLRFILPLINWGLPKFNNKSLLSKVVLIQDFKEIAARKVPKAVYDYVEGGAHQEVSLQRSADAFSRVEFQPNVLCDISKIDTTVEIFGKRISIPVIFAPTGYTRLMHHSGEIAVAEIAKKNNLIYCLSTMGTTAPDELALAVPNARLWFQFYLMKDRDASVKMIQRAQKHGFEVLILTVDTPVSGIRARDIRNGLTIPPRIGIKTLFDMAKKPQWWLNLLTTAPLEFAAFRGYNEPLAQIAAKIYDSSLNYDDITWLRTVWDGPIIVKGVQSISDAEKLADIGVSAIVLSNHGGRQLDKGPVILELLPKVVEKVGHRIDVFVDGGFMTGQDVVAAIAFGAKAVLVGRAYLYGIMAAGSDGVQKVVDILSSEISNTMALMGVSSISEIKPEHVKLRNS
ncbi:MAG: alpha-hydroxy acid oxidase [Actinobacteria bacterium]|nr:alpha-hydroxy acid oxidase [Actinomycetota bacterium]